jgi:putrescine aminotransferase
VSRAADAVAFAADPARLAADAATFAALARHGAPGLALAAKLAGRGATEVSAEGALVRLSDGRELIDFGSYGVTLLGHRHPDVLAAVTAQLARLPTSTRILANAPAPALASELAALLGGSLERVWLGSDGSDVVELAVKLARRRSGRPRVLAVRGAFHGKTLGALALTHNPAFRAGLEPLLGAVTHLDPDDPGAVRRETAAGDVAALVFEPIQGEAGARALDVEILRAWVRDAHAAGAFAISDEVQVGLRRCGEVSLALAAGLRPDAVLLGKALGGGVLPLAALVAGESLYEPLAKDPTWHSATFSGHPLACAAGIAALGAIERHAPRGAEVAARIGRGLEELSRAHPRLVRRVHGAGLLWGLQLASPAVAGSVLVELAQRGLLVSPCLSATSTIRLLPPMVSSDEHLDAALAMLGGALEASVAVRGTRAAARAARA